MSRGANAGNGNDVISILLVDDSPETRENVKKMLAFEQDFSVVGAAGTGREGIDLAKQYEPDIVIMDINMPDMDGLEATQVIDKQVPTSAVIIMSVQGDADYMRKALRAGARDFLTKPVNFDELYQTIRTVYKEYADIRRQYAAIEEDLRKQIRRPSEETQVEGERSGHVITLYSPQGGAGTTTIATSLATGLMKEGSKVLLVDANLQFADVSTFMNLQSQSTIVKILEEIDDLDTELFEHIVVTHDSGLKVLLGPSHPEYGMEIMENGEAVGHLIQQIRTLYDFIVIDTSTHIDDVNVGLFDIADQLLLIGTPTLISVRNLRFTLDLLDKWDGFDTEKTALVLNRVIEDRKKNSPTVPQERIQSFLTRPIIGQIPIVEENRLLSAINKGVPIVTFERNHDRPPIKQLNELADFVYNSLEGGEEEAEQEGANGSKKRGGIASLLGR